jgi:hypothetical protein
MTFGRGQENLWINQPEGVAQLIMSRLRLNYGEWFADTSDGTPWAAQVLGVRTQGTRDAVVRSRVFSTQGMLGILAYNSVTDPNARDWTAAMNVLTLYGQAQVAMAALPGALPPGAVVPGPAAQYLGIVGGQTALAMAPANLAPVAPANIRDFRILRLDPGAY